MHAGVAKLDFARSEGYRKAELKINRNENTVQRCCQRVALKKRVENARTKLSRLVEELGFVFTRFGWRQLPPVYRRPLL